MKNEKFNSVSLNSNELKAVFGGEQVTNYQGAAGQSGIRDFSNQVSDAYYSVKTSIKSWFAGW